MVEAFLPKIWGEAWTKRMINLLAILGTVAHCVKYRSPEDTVYSVFNE